MFVCVSLALLTNQSVSAKDLPPAGQWTVDFGDSHCIAQREHGAPDNPTYLMMKAAAIGDGLQLSIVENGVRSDGIQEKARITFGDGKTLDLWQLRYGVEKKQVRTINLTKDQVDQLSRAAELRWSTPRANYSLPLGPVAKLVKMIEKCRSTLIEDWNGTAAKKAALKQEARLDKPVGSLFSTSDYPSQAVVAGQSGTANVVGLIDENGELADCMVVQTSGIAVLDAQTCIKIKKRGRFTAAIGPDGRPARSVYVSRVRWVMP